MSEPYIHHVPGRLRVRSNWIRRSAARARRLRELLAELPGVHRVDANPAADSVTVHYDTRILGKEDLLAILADAGALGTSPPTRRLPGVSEVSPQVLTSAAALGSMFGKALFDAVLHKSVERSINILVGRRR